MNTDVNVYSNIVTKANSIDTTGIYYLINIVLFGSVIAFIVVFVYNFLKSYKDGDVNTNKRKSKKDYVKTNSIKKMVYENVCDNCGQVNELDAKFCKNCGKRLK